jgi:serine phosphatase RsbU (regulator of sigma subunit)
VVAGELPDGELIETMTYYLGYVVLGTSLGVRLATTDNAGNSVNRIRPIVYESGTEALEVTVEIIEYKGDKQPIGKHFDAKPFTQTEIQLQKNDIIYIFTDGYQDQFGGPKEKKYRVSQMRELFISIFDKPMEEQRKIIDASFETWKGELEQVDDICVIGVRI